jgi:two-component system, chemotaxis family, protein-glutamate methylesterase/glutaminase
MPMFPLRQIATPFLPSIALSPEQRMNILIIDDSAFMRKALTLALESEPGLKVIDTASNGEEGLAKIQKLRPDVVTLDIEMPIMDGLTALKHIKALQGPKPAVIVCSTLSTKGSLTALQALRLGAADVIGKDPDALGSQRPEARKELIAKVKAVGSRGMGDSKFLHVAPTMPATLKREFAWPTGNACEMVVIGSSTGGPPILEVVLSAIPKDFAAPVVVAQHMPALFTRSMAQRLATLCAIPVDHADNDTILQPGRVTIIEGGKHGRVHRLAGTGRARLEISPRPADALYKPSVNELFASAAAFGKSCLAIQLTGMGDDGKKGAEPLKNAGGLVLAQAAETCAVYGMPRAIIEAGLAAAALTPEQIGTVLKAVSPATRFRVAA